MSKNKKITLLYNYGSNLYKVYWISQCGNDIYHGFYFKNKQDFHFSYHKNGKVHLKIKEGYLSLCNRIPISEIKDIYNLHNFNVGDEEWAQKYYPPYDNKKLKDIILVDTCLFSNKIQIQVELFLVRPESLGKLSAEGFRKTNKDDYRLIQISQEINPWLVVHARNLKHLETGNPAL